MVEKIRRLRMPQRAGRQKLIIGIILVVLSLLGVRLVIDSNNQTEDFLVAANPVASGSIVTAANFRVEHLNLSDSRDIYLKPGQLDSGSYLLGGLAVGQLIPKSLVSSNIVDAREPVIIRSVMPVPLSLRVGDHVDVWISTAVANNKFSTPVSIVLGAEVEGIIQDSGVIGNQEPKVQLLVPTEAVPAILSAIASKDALSIVLKRNLADE